MLRVTKPTSTAENLLISLVYSGTVEAEYYPPMGTTRTHTLPVWEQPPAPVLFLPETAGMVRDSIILILRHSILT